MGANHVTDLPAFKVAPVLVISWSKDVHEAVVFIRRHGIPVPRHLQAVLLARCCIPVEGAVSALFHLLLSMQVSCHFWTPMGLAG